MATYLVINPTTGGVLNRIAHVANEQSYDSEDVRNRKRREEANRKLIDWLDTVYRLKVVAKR